MNRLTRNQCKRPVSEITVKTSLSHIMGFKEYIISFKTRQNILLIIVSYTKLSFCEMIKSCNHNTTFQIKTDDVVQYNG